jgi:drug/metabolite transporter (DMT)-like permease
VLILGTVCTAAAFILFAALIGEIGPVRSTVIVHQPAVAAIVGVAVLWRRSRRSAGLGLALVIAGSALATRRPAPPAAEAGPTRSGSPSHPRRTLRAR